jgi:hypothetical protein
MVSRWAHACKPILPLLAHYFVNAFKHTANCQASAFLCFLVKICVKHSNIGTVRSFGPQTHNVFKILLRMHQLNILVCHYSAYCADVLYFGVIKVKLFLQHFHYKFHPLWLLWMLTFAFMFHHSWVINKASL